MTEVLTVALFTATDRCDRCTARATVRAVLPKNGDLVFCDHHLRRYRPALVPLVARFERHIELADALALVPPAGR